VKKTPVRFRHVRGKVSKPNPDARCVDRSSRWGKPYDWRKLGRAVEVSKTRDRIVS
jgi:hypothetical protein